MTKPTENVPLEEGGQTYFKCGLRAIAERPVKELIFSRDRVASMFRNLFLTYADLASRGVIRTDLPKKGG